MRNFNQQLLEFPLFSGIKEEEIEPMLTCLGSYIKTYSKQEIIYLENENIRSIGIILEGTVHMIKNDLYGNETLLLYLTKKDLIGETFACGNDTHSYVSFLASTPCKVLFLPFHKVIHTCNNSCIFHHQLIENMVQLISAKNILLMNKIEIVSKKTLREKILSFLLLQAQYYNSNSFTLPIGRIELAQYLLTNRSALTRELSKMQEEGLIRFQKNTYHLLNDALNEQKNIT